MNFILIPFFLAASIIVDDSAKWQYGLVAHFRANITWNSESFKSLRNVSTVFTCRQKSMDELLCSSPSVLRRKPEFLVKFNKNGIESFSFQGVVFQKDLSLIRLVMKELSIGVDLLQHANALSAFVANENYVLGECSTLFTVLQEVGSPTLSNFDKKQNFTLDMLSMPQRKPGANVIIEKRTNSKWCNRTNVDDDTTSATSHVSGKSVTKMHIGTNTFVSLNKFTAKTKQLRENRSFITEMTTYVELMGIEPATEELPSLSGPEMAMLYFTDTRLINNFVPTGHWFTLDDFS